MDKLITVIVPVYNAGRYIVRCIDSLITQTYPTLQIVIVDDGSTDNSRDICEAYAMQDERIEVIWQKNGGASAARNTGLDIARGEWIAFTDADDFVSPYYIEDMYNAVCCDGAEMAICRAAWVKNEGGGSEHFKRDDRIRYITGREACMRNFSKDVSLYNSVWGKIFLARLWDGLRFPEGKINEDMYISHALLYRTGRIAIMDAVLYAYVQTEGSVMRSAFSPKHLDILDAWQEGVRFFYGAGNQELLSIARRVYCSRVFDAQCICRRKIPHEKEILHQLRIRAAEAYRVARPIRGYADCSKYKSTAYRIKLLVGRWNPWLYSFLFLHGRDYL